MIMSKQLEHIQARNRSIASSADVEGSPCQHDDSSLSSQAKGYSGPDLPEDIWPHIHSLMQLRDAARAACVSRTFLCSWRRYPNLDFSTETLGLNGTVFRNDETAGDFTSIVGHILKKHSGVGLKTLKIRGAPANNAKDRCYLDSWFQMAVTVTPGLEELTLSLGSEYRKYKFPYSLFSHGNGDLIRFLHLTSCTVSPTVGLGCFRSLTRLYLCMVRITGNELGCLLSNSFALEHIQLRSCSQIGCVKIPCLLLRLSYLEVLTCNNLHVIDSQASNISSFRFEGRFLVQLLLGEATSEVKTLDMRCCGAVCYTRSELVSRMPNLESLTIDSTWEMVNTPMLSSKFLHLKYLCISFPTPTFSPSYDYFSLISFLDASPCLESLILDTWQEAHMEDVSVFSDAWELRQMPEHKHDKLRTVKIWCFTPMKSLVELTCHILGIATSLEWLTLDTKFSGQPEYCCVSKGDKCYSIPKGNILEAHRALQAIQTYIKPKVPFTVNLNVVEPCSRCHVVEV